MTHTAAWMWRRTPRKVRQLSAAPPHFSPPSVAQASKHFRGLVVMTQISLRSHKAKILPACRAVDRRAREGALSHRALLPCQTVSTSFQPLPSILFCAPPSTPEILQHAAGFEKQPAPCLCSGMVSSAPLASDNLTVLRSHSGCSCAACFMPTPTPPQLFVLFPACL